MHTSHLGKHVLADNGLISSNGNAAITLNHSTDTIELALSDVRLGMKLIFQYGLNTGHGSIAATLTQSVHRDMYTLGTTEYSSKCVAHRQVVVVMGMIVKVHVGIAFHHLTEILDDLQRIHNAQCVRKHETTDGSCTLP